jgi:uncharacterized membrane protein
MTNNNNQIDLGQIYGLTGCSNSKYVNPHGNNIHYPTLEQIANYNNLPSSPTGSMRDTRQSMNNGNQNASSNSNNSIDNPAMTNNMNMSQDNTIPQSTPTMDGSTTDGQEIYEYSQPYPITASNIQYLNSFLRTQIGRAIEVNFLLGGNTMMQVGGYLLGVGADFVLINEYGTNNITSCDFYNIKYIRFFY